MHEHSWYDFLAAQPEEMAMFQHGMGARHENEPAAVIEAVDFAPFRTVMDLGGGNGQLLSAILAAAPHLQGVLIDLPGAIAAAEAGEGGPLPRTRCIAHDILRTLPARGDLIILKHVVHNWNDREAALILGHARAALEPGGRVMVLDAMLESGDRPDPCKLLDVHMMLLLPGGQERSHAEFDSLFRAAGLRLVGVHKLMPGLVLFEGEAAV